MNYFIMNGLFDISSYEKDNLTIYSYNENDYQKDKIEISYNKENKITINKFFEKYKNSIIYLVALIDESKINKTNENEYVYLEIFGYIENINKGINIKIYNNKKNISIPYNIYINLTKKTYDSQLYIKSYSIYKIPNNIYIIPNNKTNYNNRNYIISGTPGCGKSYFVNEYTLKNILGENKPEDRYKRITFTEGMTYEDFFGCYKPVVVSSTSQDENKDKIINDNCKKNTENIKQINQTHNNAISYDFVPGPFSTILNNAINDKENNYVLIIEELNRGHVYEIFRGIFQLLDRNNDGESTYHINIPEEAKKYFSIESLYLPKNFFIICTMNNADSRVEYLDTAFKRRFNYGYMDEEGLLYCSNDIPGAENYIKDLKEDNNDYSELCKIMNCTFDKDKYNVLRNYINEKLKENNISEDKLVSKYFLNTNNKNISVFDFVIKICGYLLQNVLRNNINLSNAFFGNINITITIPFIFTSLKELINNNELYSDKNENLLTKIVKTISNKKTDQSQTKSSD